MYEKCLHCEENGERSILTIAKRPIHVREYMEEGRLKVKGYRMVFCQNCSAVGCMDYLITMKNPAEQKKQQRKRVLKN